MKKVLLTAIALLTIASTSVFGMYGANSDWIDFLVHGNQLRARMQQFGFVLGNDMIKGTVGFRSEGSTLGAILDTTTVNSKQFFNFLPTVSVGIGYTSDVFGIGLGYNYTYRHNKFSGMTKNGYGLSIHTPVLAINAMNDSLRIAIPVQIAVKNGDKAPDAAGLNGTDKTKYMGISMDPQIRYYTGIEAFNEIRLYIKYGMNQYTDQGGTKQTGSSFGFDFRAYFGATVGDVALKPFLKVTYDTALDAKGKHGSGSYNVKSDSLVYNYSSTTIGAYDSNPWQLKVLPTLGMSANSDIVSIYVEAGLGYKATDSGYKLYAGNNGVKHDLAWSSYGEIYITPVKDLEWYFEAEIGNYNLDNLETAGTIGGDLNVQFNASTGITWYLPAL
ncbi:variable surface protein VspD [Brachyspira pilosicoli B2904]|uniref:Variable surface protein VspD n=1 Tax=Brachyspira pilosicoli B2904 TaxID=1133568 RepID=J9UQJ0_BRAPL|nr:variable surface family protein [Brachyspira pilosicoli]AFR69744.1 variable surface protein VspD [Brachyspira pilosicoli B2904]